MRKVMRVLRKSSSSSESGAAAVEFAIVVPVLLLLLFAIFDYGRFFLVQMAMTSATQEGVRASVLGQSNGNVVAAYHAAMPNSLITLGTLGDMSTCYSTDPQSCVAVTAAECIAAGNTGTTTVSSAMSFTWIATGALWFFTNPNQPPTVGITSRAKCNG